MTLTNLDILALSIFGVVVVVIAICEWDIVANTEMQDTSGKDLEIMKKLRKK